jgi:ankyrin repeat protein
MSSQTAPATMTDDETAAFAEQVFERARQGDADMLGRLLASGLPPNLRNHKGDTLLMLASYHGHHDAVRVLLAQGADPLIANDNGQLPIAGAAFKGIWR